jgi:anti-sigma factor NepR-like protein
MMGEHDTDKASAKDAMEPDATTNVPHQPAPPGLGAELQAHIGRQLRAVYDEIAHQPVPERFLALLEELERKQPAKP